MQTGSTFRLEGWEKEFSSVKELTDSLKTFVLKSGQDCFTVKKCCLPRPAGVVWWCLLFLLLLYYLSTKYVPDKGHFQIGVFTCYFLCASPTSCSSLCVCITELSNLLVMRQGTNNSAKPMTETLNLSQLRFHQIKDKEITQVSLIKHLVRLVRFLNRFIRP